MSLAACSSSSTTVATAPANALDLPNPPEIVSANGVARVVLTAAINPATGGPGILYAGAFLPPTIRVSPGDTIDISYTNTLPPATQEPLNATNLHFHGLATSPNPPADDAIDILSMPGQTLHYIVPITKRQPPGLYWYHAHAHHEANWQLYNGMSGAIVVNGTAAFASETTGLPERVIVLRNVLAQPQFSALSAALRKAAARARAAAQTRDAAVNDGVCQQPFNVDSEYTTINGRSAGTTLAMRPGSRQLWRVVNASADGYYNLSVDGQQLQVVSIDGVPLEMYPGGSEQRVNNIVIPPAGRAEFIVSGPAAPTAFRTTCFDTGPAGDPNPSQVLATIEPGVTALGSVPAAGLTKPPIGTFQTAIGASFAQRRTLAFTEDDTGTNFYLNDQQYVPAGGPMFTAKLGTVEQWTLLNATQEVHAFHIHQIHFITQDVDGVAQVPVWRDTLSLPIAHADGTPSASHVLLDFRDPIIRGEFLFHCHLVQHEDDGMMAKLRVQ
jgi:FtsP/CotA-like multicopper oxidase with cupredoxin domain